MSSDRPSESFASLFEQQTTNKPARSFRIGDRLEVTVVRVGKSSVFVELDGKRQGFFEAAELTDSNGQLTVGVGDRVIGHLVEVHEAQGVFRFAKTMGKTHGVEGLEQAAAAGLPVEGKVSGVNKGGFEVDVGGVRAFCPMGQIDARFVQDTSVFVGQTLSFLVKEVKDNGRSVTLSRRALLEREAQEQFAKIAESIVAGATLSGTITSVRDFGAFVDLGGVEGMIPRSEIGHDRSVAVADVLKPGERVEVLVRDVKEVTPEPGRGRGRPGPSLKITLSLKALMADPWEGIDVSEGQVLRGKVVRVQPFGAFVQIAVGVDGLLHVSETGKTPVAEGDDVVVVIKKLDANAKKISLGLAPEGAEVGSRLEPSAPRAPAQNRPIAVNAVVNGVVEKIETFGLFVQVDGTSGRAGRGLVPNVETGLPRGADLRKAFPEGTKVTVKVLETGEGKLRLSIRGAKEAEERAQYEEARSKVQGSVSFGSFGDLMKKAEQSKKSKKK